jgi:DNA invertase Pin-like site-specific DNA recombinase
MSKKGKVKRAALFLRARVLGRSGRDDQAESHLIEGQRQACEQAAKRLQAAVVREYVEYGGTGAIERRPVMRQMLDELLALRDVDYLVTPGLDRLARSSADMAALQLTLEAAGVELVCAEWTHANRPNRANLRAIVRVREE